MSNNFYNFISTQGFIYGGDVDAKFQTHIVQPHGSNYNIQLQLTTPEQFKELYLYAQKCGNLKIMCNPGMELSRKLFIDIDGYKPEKGIELNTRQIIFIQNMFCIYAKYMFKATKFIVANKPGICGNVHITANTVVANVWYQRFFIHKLKQVVKYTMGDATTMFMDTFDADFMAKYINEFDYDEFMDIYKAIDDAPGIRALYSAKPDNTLDYYKIHSFAADIPSDEYYIKHCLNADPCFNGSISMYECPLLLDAAVMNYKEYRINHKGKYVTHDCYMAEYSGEIVPLEEVLTTIAAIPEPFLKGYEWRKTLMRVKSQLNGGDGNRNTNIMAAFDDISQAVAGEYDAAENAAMYDSANIEIDGYKKLVEDINKYNENKPANNNYTAECIKSAMMQTRTFIRDEINDVENINDKYIDINFADIDAKTIILKSATGTGKTTNLINFINHHKDAKILYIGCRKSLLRSLKDTYCDDGTIMFDYYETMNWKAAREDGKYNRILIQMESVSRVSAAMVAEFDYIFMDEYNSVIEQLSSPNFIDPYNAMNILMCIFQAQCKLIIMDGYLSKQYIDLLESVRPSAVYNRKIIDNTAQNKTNETMVMVTNIADMNELILAAINDGKRFVVAADSKATCKRIAKMIEIRNAEMMRYKRIFMVNGDNSGLDDTMRIMENINTEIINYDYFIYSPSITAGVDVAVPHFDIQFNIFTTNAVSGNANLQMINRVRHKNDLLSYTFINKRRQIKRTSAMFMAEYASRSYQIQSNSLLRLSFIPCGNYNIVCDNPMLRIITESKVIKENQNNIAIKCYIQQLINQGYNIIIHENTNVVNFEMPDTLKSAVIKSSIKKEEAAKIAAADAKDHKKIVCTTAEMKDEKHKYIIKTVYKLEDAAITAEFVEKHGKYKDIKAFNQRIVLYNTTNLSSYVNAAIEKDLLKLEYEPDIFAKEIFANCRTNKHYIIGAYVLSRALNIADFKNIIKNQIVITRAKLIENINNNFDDDLKLSDIMALFKCRVNIRNCATMKELANENPRSLLTLINVIIDGLYGIKLAAATTKYDKYVIKIGGYIPESYDRFVN